MAIHARPSVIEDLERIFPWAFDGQNLYRGYIKPEPRPVEGPFHIGRTEIHPLPVAHGKVETIGYLFQRDGHPRFAYLPDCKILPPETIELIKGVDTLVIDALRYSPHPTHMNIREALAAVDHIAPRQAWFTHIADEIMHARTESELPEGVGIAHDGLRIHC